MHHSKHYIPSKDLAYKLGVLLTNKYILVLYEQYCPFTWYLIGFQRSFWGLWKPIKYKIMNLSKMTDQELKDLTTELKNEQEKRKIKKMPDDELFKIAKAKNGTFSDEEAVSALNVLLEKEKPNLELISALKQMSHSETVREKCKEYLFA